MCGLWKDKQKGNKDYFIKNAQECQKCGFYFANLLRKVYIILFLLKNISKFKALTPNLN